MWVVFDYVFTYWKGILTIVIPFALLPIPLILESKPDYFSNNKYNKNANKTINRRRVQVRSDGGPDGAVLDAGPDPDGGDGAHPGGAVPTHGPHGHQ